MHIFCGVSSFFAGCGYYDKRGHFLLTVATTVSVEIFCAVWTFLWAVITISVDILLWGADIFCRVWNFAQSVVTTVSGDSVCGHFLRV